MLNIIHKHTGGTQNPMLMKDYWKVPASQEDFHCWWLVFYSPPFISICGPGPDTSLHLQLLQFLSGFPFPRFHWKCFGVNASNFLQKQTNDVFSAFILQDLLGDLTVANNLTYHTLSPLFSFLFYQLWLLSIARWLQVVPRNICHSQ